VEEAFKDGVPGITKYWTEVLQKQLLDLVFLVRQKLTKQEIVTLNALIVIDVHAKDVVEKLWREEIDDINSFEWIS
jgi:dynein heavy chain